MMQLIAMLALLLLSADEKTVTHGPSTPVPVRRAVKAEADQEPQRVRLLGPSLQQPSPDKPIVVSAGRFVPLASPGEEPSYVAPQSAYRIYRVKLGGSFAGIKFDAAENAEPEVYEWPDATTPVLVVLAREAPGLYSMQLLKNGPVAVGPVENGKPFAIQIVSGIGPRPPPVPPLPPGPTPPPDPPPVPPTPPDPPTPQPVTSFRVIFVKESGTTLSAVQTAIPGAKVIREYLFAKTTRENGVTGWREYDDGVDVTNEQPTMRALWEAVKPKIVTVPCLVIEVNKEVKIHPYPENVTKALNLLKTYGGT